mmetsp:Transcript_22945/g.56536  ORF Transcript_22945/g.56536 Transcript_22945/m.56536 type:complete len:247 (-) Transcript_22945:172-912(-)
MKRMKAAMKKRMLFSVSYGGRGHGVLFFDIEFFVAIKTVIVSTAVVSLPVGLLVFCAHYIQVLQAFQKNRDVPMAATDREMPTFRLWLAVVMKMPEPPATIAMLVPMGMRRVQQFLVGCSTFSMITTMTATMTLNIYQALTLPVVHRQTMKFLETDLPATMRVTKIPMIAQYFLSELSDRQTKRFLRTKPPPTTTIATKKVKMSQVFPFSMQHGGQHHCSGTLATATTATALKMCRSRAKLPTAQQ